MQTRLYQIAYTVPESSVSLQEDLKKTDADGNTWKGQQQTIDAKNVDLFAADSSNGFFFHRGEYMKYVSKNEANGTITVQRGALSTPVREHTNGEGLRFGVINPPGTDDRELRKINSVDTSGGRVKSIGDIESTLEYKKAKFRISNTSVTVRNLPKRTLRDAGSIHTPWVFEVLDGQQVVFSGILDAESVKYTAGTRNTQFDVLSWLEILDRAEAVPARYVYEASVAGTKSSAEDESFVAFRAKDVQIKLNFDEDDDPLPQQVGKFGDVAVIETADDTEIREQIDLKAPDPQDGKPVLFLSTQDEGSEAGSIVDAYPDESSFSPGSGQIVSTYRADGVPNGGKLRLLVRNDQQISDLVNAVDGDISDLDQGQSKMVNVGSDLALEVAVNYDVFSTNILGNEDARNSNREQIDTITRFRVTAEKEGFVLQKDLGRIYRIEDGGITRNPDGVDNVEYQMLLKRTSVTGIALNLENDAKIKILGRKIYGDNGIDTDTTQGLWGNESPTQYDIRELIEAMFTIEAGTTQAGTATGRPQLGVLPHVFASSEYQSVNSLSDKSEAPILEPGAELPEDPLKSLRMMQQKGQFLLKERFTSTTNSDGDTLPGYYPELVYRDSFFNSAAEVSKRRVKSWSEDVADEEIRAVVVRSNKDYLKGRGAPEADKRIGFYFDGIERYEEDGDDAKFLRHRMSPPEGRGVIEIEMPILPNDEVGKTYSGRAGDADVYENNPKLRKLAEQYYRHFNTASRKVELEFGDDQTDWLGGYWYFKQQGEVVDDPVFVTQETKSVDETSITASLTGRIGEEIPGVEVPAPTAIIKGPRVVGNSDSTGNVGISLRGSNSFSLADHRLTYVWERKLLGGNYSVVQGSGARLQDDISEPTQKTVYKYRLTVTDTVTGDTGTDEHRVAVNPGTTKPAPQPRNEDFEVNTWQRNEKAFLEVVPDQLLGGVASVVERSAAGANIEDGQSFSAVPLFEVPVNVNTSTNTLTVTGNYRAELDKPAVYVVDSNGERTFFDVDTVSYSGGDTTIELIQSIDASYEKVGTGSFVTSVALTVKHTSAIEARVRGGVKGQVGAVTKTFDFKSLAEVDASVYVDGQGVVFADVVIDEDTDEYDIDYSTDDGATWIGIADNPLTDNTIGKTVYNALADGSSLQVRVVPRNPSGETGKIVQRAVFHNPSTGGGGGSGVFDTLTVNGAGTIDSIQNNEFRFLGSGGSDNATINVSEIKADSFNGVDLANLARTHVPETFADDVVVQGNLTVNGTEFIANTQTVEIADNLAIINKGETGNGVSAGFSGWEVDRGTATNFKFGFDETRDRFVVGKGGDRDVVATRENNPSSEGIAYWNGTENRFDTSSSLGWDGSDVLIGSGHATVSDRTETISGKWTHTARVVLDGSTLRTKNAVTGFAGSGTILDETSSWFDNVQVRGAFFAREFDVRKLSYSKGGLVLGPGGGKIESGQSASGTYQLIFAEHPGVESGDQLLVKEVDEQTGNTREARLDVTTGATKLSQNKYEVVAQLVGGTAPQVGDEAVVVGSSNGSRDSSIYANPFIPAISVLDGISDFTDWNNRTPTTRFGKIDGMPSVGGVSPSGHGLWGNNVYLEGTIVANKGTIGNSVTVGGTAAQNLAADSDLFSKNYNDLFNTPTLGAVSELDEISSTYIGNGAVITSKIAAGAVVANKIATNAVTSQKISVGSVTDIDSDAAVVSDIFSGNYGDLSGTPSLGNVAALNKITSTYIQNGTIVTANIASGQITTDKLDTNAVTANKISVGSVKDIDSDAAVASDVFSGNYNSLFNKPTLGAVAELNEIGSTFIGNGAVISSKIAANAVTANEIAANSISSTEISIGSVTQIDSDAAVVSDVFSGNYGDLSNKPSLGSVAELNKITSTYIQNGTIVTANIGAGQITANEIDVNDLFAQDITFTGQIRTANSEVTLNAGYGLSMLATDSVGEKSAVSWFTNEQGYAQTQSKIQGVDKDLFLTSDGDVRMTAEGFYFKKDPGIDSGKVPRFSVDLRFYLRNLPTSVSGSWEVYRDSNNFLKINVPSSPSDPYARIVVSEKDDANKNVTFDASGSSSDDGTNLAFRFDFTNDGTYDTNWSTSPVRTSSYGSYTTYTAKVQVKDGGGRTKTDTVTFTLEDPNSGGGGGGNGDSSIAF